MLKIQFDVRKINQLKELLIRLRDGATAQSIADDFDKYFATENIISILMIKQELLNGDYDITVEDLKYFVKVLGPLYDKHDFGAFPKDHPIQIFLAENKALTSLISKIDFLFNVYETEQDTARLAELKEAVIKLGEFQNHYHRKQKLYFPILERYNHFTTARYIWKQDDRIYALYKGFRKLIDHLPESELKAVRKAYESFQVAFQEMVFQEEDLLLPVFALLFHESDWDAIAAESNAYGYALEDEFPEQSKRYQGLGQTFVDEKIIPEGNIPFGSGYLTLKEANLILNNIPLEITFVDKNSVFKYFNNITKASDMMFIRTPISLGRNVANCHPPKSLKKVMQLIRDLKTKKRTEESMWFKKADKWIHITYKALFDEADEFMGILEYVQDIQPFMELPTDGKRNLSPIE